MSAACPHSLKNEMFFFLGTDALKIWRDWNKINIFSQVQEQSVAGHAGGVHHLLVAPQPHQLAGGH